MTTEQRDREAAIMKQYLDAFTVMADAVANGTVRPQLAVMVFGQAESILVEAFRKTLPTTDAIVAAIDGKVSANA